MVHAIRMPKPGQMTEECVLAAWVKQVGDTVSRGDVVFEIETDKSVMEVEAFDEGVLLAQLVKAGDSVPVNTICGYIGEQGEVIPPSADDAQAEPETDPTGTVATRPASALVHGAAADVASRSQANGQVGVSPRAARVAAAAGLDPHAIQGTGPGGRVVERDVLSVAARAGSTTRSREPAPAVTPFDSSPDDNGSRPLSRMRRVIADRLTTSWTSTPHFTITVAVDMSRLFALRDELKTDGTNLSVTDFVLAATAQSLVEVPDVNARTDGVSVWHRQRVHLGIAVSVSGGLLVPVIRDADRLSITDLRDRARSLIERARAGQLPADELSGSTFTVSNLGMLNVETFSAIINPGEAGILAVASAVMTPVVLGEGIAIRPIMKLTLSADHRVVDGEVGARFANAVRRRLEDASMFRMEVLND